MNYKIGASASTPPRPGRQLKTNFIISKSKMFNGNGDLNAHYLGDGSTTNPSEAFFYEQNTGIYHDNDTYPNTAWTLVKKGNKRIRVDDSATTFYGTVNIPSLVPGGTLSLVDGSQSAPSLNYTSQTNTGLYHGTSPSSVSVTVQGATGLIVEDDKVTVPDTLVTSTIEADLVECSRVKVTPDSAPLPGFTWYDDDDTGFYQPASGSVSVTTNGTSRMVWEDSKVTSSVPLRLPDGSSSSPSYSFTSGTQSGLSYDSTTASMDVSISNTRVGRFLNNGLPGPTGKGIASDGALQAATIILSPEAFINKMEVDSTLGVATPPYTFFTDQDTGIYNPSSNKVGISCGGTEVLDCSTSALTASSRVLLPTGTTSSPSLSFSGSTQSGIYYSSTSAALDVTVNGSIAAEFFNTGGGPAPIGISTPGFVQVATTVTAPLGVIDRNLAGSGSALSPSYSFNNDPNTGIHNPSADTLAISTGGTNRVTVSTSLVSSTLDINYPRYIARLTRTAVLSITNATSTIVTWDTASTVNWTVSTPATQLTIPKDGYYLVTYDAVWVNNIIGIREHWIELNNGGTPEVKRRYAETCVNASSAGPNCQTGAFTRAFVAGDQLSLCVYQNSGTSTNNFSAANGGNSLSTMEIVRLSE